MEPSASTDTITKSCHMDIAAREAGKCHVRRKEGTLCSPQSATEGGWWGFGLLGKYKMILKNGKYLHSNGSTVYVVKMTTLIIHYFICCEQVQI